MNFAGANVSWFDGVVLTMIVWGCWRGWQRGLSAELLPGLQWLLVLGLGAVLAPPLGRVLSRWGGLALPLAVALVFVAQAGALKCLFAWLEGMLETRPALTVHFGRAEHPVGMVAGALRYAAMCLAVLVLALAFDAREAQRRTAVAPADETFEDLVTTVLVSLQQDMLYRSFSGRLARQLTWILLSPQPARDSQGASERTSRPRSPSVAPHEPPLPSVAADVRPRCWAPLAADGQRRLMSAATWFMITVQFKKEQAALHKPIFLTHLPSPRGGANARSAGEGDPRWFMGGLADGGSRQG